MIVFVSLCALMLSAAIVLLVRPLLARNEGDAKAGRVSVAVFTGVMVAAIATAVYLGNTNWPWQHGAPTSAVADVRSDRVAIDELLQQTRKQPDNQDTWVMLGKAYVDSDSFALAANAFQQAYDLSQGQNVEAIAGLVEALVLADQTSMNGRAAVLVEQALKLQPNQPKALWYGGLIALRADNLPLARERFKAILALNPPPQVRTLLERQVMDLNEQLGEPTNTSAASGAGRKVTVKVSVSSAIHEQLKQPVTLFVLARNPNQPGPPLAVERHTSGELPLQVELSADDAMLPSRTLASADTVEIVARLSASGSPIEQSGDYVGRATYSFAKQGEQGDVAIEIDHRVP